MKTPEKFYIVAERYNPQLGMYLCDVIVGNKRVNKNSITCVYNFYGSTEKMKFAKEAYNNNGCHECLSKDNCIYGSMHYIGFETAENAKTYLDNRWSKEHRYQSCIAKLVA